MKYILLGHNQQPITRDQLLELIDLKLAHPGPFHSNVTVMGKDTVLINLNILVLKGS